MRYIKCQGSKELVSSVTRDYVQTVSSHAATRTFPERLSHADPELTAGLKKVNVHVQVKYHFLRGTERRDGTLGQQRFA